MALAAGLFGNDEKSSFFYKNTLYSRLECKKHTQFDQIQYYIYHQSQYSITEYTRLPKTTLNTVAKAGAIEYACVRKIII